MYNNNTLILIMNANKDDAGLQHVYKELMENEENDFFNTYDEFIDFCNTKIEPGGALVNLVNAPKVEMKKKILEKIMTYELTHTDGKPNPPITFFKKPKYKRHKNY